MQSHRQVKERSFLAIRPLLLVMGLMGPAVGAFGFYGVFLLLLCCIPTFVRSGASRLEAQQASICMLGVAILAYGLIPGVIHSGAEWAGYQFAVIAISGSVFVAFTFVPRAGFSIDKLMRWLWRFSWILLTLCLLEVFSGVRLPVSRYSAMAPYLGFAYEGSEGVSEVFEGLWVPTGFFGNQNNLSFMLTCLLPFALADCRTAAARMTMAATSFFVIFLSESRVALVTLVVWGCTSAFVAALRHVKPWSLAVILVLAAGAVPLAYNTLEETCAEATTKLCFGVTLLHSVDLEDLPFLNDSIGIRLQLASQALRLWAASPIVGVGPGHLSHLISAVHSDGIVITDLHNPPLQVLVEYGIAGSALWLSAFWIVLRSVLAIPRMPARSGKFRKVALTLLWIMPIASISVSTMYYFIPLWVLLGTMFGAALELNRGAAGDASHARSEGGSVGLADAFRRGVARGAH